MSVSDTVQPGLHSPQLGDHDVVWWDPHVLPNAPASESGIRHQAALVKPPEEDAEAGRKSLKLWRQRLDRARHSGHVPSVVAESVTRVAQEAWPDVDGLGADSDESDLFDDDDELFSPEETRPVEVVVVPGQRAGRAHGKRFGTLLHSVLEEVPLDSDRAGLIRVAMAQGRILGADGPEVSAAVDAAEAALAHPLMRRAAVAAACWREVDLALLDDGRVVEGRVDLAFREETDDGATWVVVDFKSDLNVGGPMVGTVYTEQVALYVRAVTEATGEPATGVLLMV